jgi:hypothetical protein
MVQAQFDAEEILRAALPHALNLDPVACERLDTLIAKGANKLAQDPNRVSEAIKSMHVFVQHLQGQPQSLQDAVITKQHIDFALQKLCPLFPIC